MQKTSDIIWQDTQHQVLFELIEKSGTQYGQGFGFVFMLGFFILAGDHQSCGQMGYSYSRVGRIDALSAGT